METCPEPVEGKENHIRKVLGKRRKPNQTISHEEARCNKVQEVQEVQEVQDVIRFKRFKRFKRVKERFKIKKL